MKYLKCKTLDCFNAFLLLLLTTVSSGIAHSQCPHEANNFLEKYWASRENFRNYFIANAIDEQTGNLLSDGIGTWDCERNMYSMAGVGIPANSINMVHLTPTTDFGNTAKYGDATYGLGRYMAMLSTEYDLLSQSGQNQAKKRTLNELFLALQAYRRLDMTANRIWAKHRLCNCIYPGPSPNLSGYSGFFIRDDANWVTTLPLVENWNYPNLPPTGIESDFVSTDVCSGRAIPKPGGMPWERLDVPCDECPDGGYNIYNCGNVPSQDQISGLLFGLSFVKKFIPPGIYAEIDGVPYEDDVLTIAQKIAHGLVKRVIDGGGFLRYPTCTSNSPIGDKININGSADARFAVYGMIEAANLITQGNSSLFLPHISMEISTNIPGFEVIELTDKTWWRIGCNWNIAGPTDFSLLNVAGLPPIPFPLLEDLFRDLLELIFPETGVSNYFNQRFWIDLMVAGDTNYHTEWGNDNESAQEIIHRYDNWLMMQHFAMNVLHDNAVLSQNDVDWMKDVLCEFACPGACYIPPGADPDYFDCDNVVGGHWDCETNWLNGPGDDNNCPTFAVQKNGLDYMLAYNLFHLAGKTTNQNYFNPFDYEITTENRNELAEGYDGVNQVVTVTGNLTPCDRTIQDYYLGGASMPCPEITGTSNNLEILTFWSGWIQLRILSNEEDSWVQIADRENDPNCTAYDQCHLPRKIKITLDIKDKCDLACTTNNGQDIHVNTDQTWGIDEAKSFLNATVYVHSPATLTIANSISFFNEQAGIHVDRGAKLVVNGSTLTRCPQSVNWRGIGVSGNSAFDQPDYSLPPVANNAGIVYITNSLIEKARFGIITAGSFNDYFNPAYYGGLVRCFNSKFLNNTVGAVFFKYDKTNKSIFNNCKFINEGVAPTFDNTSGASYGIGVLINDTDGILFSNCEFSGMYSGGSGIKLFDAGCTVQNGCKFYNNHYGIDASSTAPVASSGPIVVIGSDPNWNVFEDNFNAIRSFSQDLYKNLVITGNIIKNTNHDAVQLSGPTSSSIHDNTFLNCDIGVSTFSMGTAPNDIYCNKFDEQSPVGIWLEGIHSGTTFLNNEFASTGWCDLLVSDRGNLGEIGEVNPLQGDVGQPADNCFSPNHSLDLFTYGNTVSFKYYVPDNNPPVCKLPEDNTGYSNYDVVQTFSTSGVNCTFPSFQDPFTPPTYADYINIKNQLSSLFTQVASNPNDLTILSEYLDAKRRKEWMISWFIREAIKTDFQTAETVLNEEATTKARRQLYGLRLQRNNLQGAATALAAIPINNEDDLIFRNVQQINLGRHQSGSNEYVLTPEQDLYLQGVASGNSTSKEHAMGLLNMLKGEDFILEHRPIDFLGERSALKNSEPGIVESGFSIHPNPTKGKLTVTFTEEQSETVRISIFGLGSLPIKTFSFATGNSFDLDLENLPFGVYFVKIKVGAALKGVEKVVIMN